MDALLKIDLGQRAEPVVLQQVDPNTGTPLTDPVTGEWLYRPVFKDHNSTVIGTEAAAVRGWGTALGYRAAAYGYQSNALGSFSFVIVETRDAP